MNSAYVLGAVLAKAFDQKGWCGDIHDKKIENLPGHIFCTDDGSMDMCCPTEVAITDRRQAELSKLGFLPLCHYKNTDYAVFFGTQTTQKPRKYGGHEATENAAIAARLPYLMATSRFIHAIKIISAQAVNQPDFDVEALEQSLGRWINNYCGMGPWPPPPEGRSLIPLREGIIKVVQEPGKAGLKIHAFLRPWLGKEELYASMMVIIPLRGEA